jgi:hypothetical protein
VELLERFAVKKLILLLSFAFTTLSFSQSIDLTWQDNSDNETGFYVERAEVLSQGEYGEFFTIATLEENSESYTDSEVVLKTTYAYRVRAYNSHGSSGYTNVAYGLAEILTPTSKPSMLLVVFVAPNGKTYGVDFNPDGEPCLAEMPIK